MAGNHILLKIISRK